MQDQTKPLPRETVTGFEYSLQIQEPLDHRDDEPETVLIQFLPISSSDSIRRLPNGIQYSPLND
jgi:hypothetical protein